MRYKLWKQQTMEGLRVSVSQRHYSYKAFDCTTKDAGIPAPFLLLCLSKTITIHARHDGRVTWSLGRLVYNARATSSRLLANLGGRCRTLPFPTGQQSSIHYGRQRLWSAAGGARPPDDGSPRLRNTSSALLSKLYSYSAG